MEQFGRPSEQKIKEWQDKLIGKYVLETNEPVGALGENEVIRVDDLPNPKQILPPGAPQRRDYIPNRMNVFLDDHKRITQVYFA